MTQDADVEIYRGAQLRLVAVRAADGGCPVDEFLEMLRKKQPRARAQFRVMLERLGDIGTLRNPELLRRIQMEGEPPVYEVKAHDGPGWRLYVIPVGDTWYFTHGRKKPKDSAVSAEGKKARRIYGDRRT